jgi:hypothetical protein
LPTVDITAVHCWEICINGDTTLAFRNGGRRGDAIGRGFAEKSASKKPDAEVSGIPCNWI